VKLGFLHRGDANDGLRRYGRLLAGEARRRAGLQVVEADEPDALAGAAVVHLQYNARVWGGGWRQLAALDRALDALARSGAAVVVTLHDVYPGGDPWAPFRKKRPRLAQRMKRALATVTERVPGDRALARILRRAAVVLVCSRTERERLAGWRDQDKVRVVRHFVEERGPLPPRVEAKRAIDLAGGRVLTLLGFVHPRKGYQLAVEALPLLPDDVTLVCAGAPSPGNEMFASDLARAGAGRCIVTGWLDAEEQELHLAATDLALCPFRFFSASGSLSTWISAHRPVLAHALPQIAEYRELEPDAFVTFEPYTAEALAAAANAALTAPGAASARSEDDPGMARLHQRLALPRIFDEHLAVYRDAAGAAR
jgi:glycosyltransferase involved in cell wall biosynthesis